MNKQKRAAARKAGEKTAAIIAELRGGREDSQRGGRPRRNGDPPAAEEAEREDAQDGVEQNKDGIPNDNDAYGEGEGEDEEDIDDDEDEGGTGTGSRMNEKEFDLLLDSLVPLVGDRVAVQVRDQLAGATSQLAKEVIKQVGDAFPALRKAPDAQARGGQATGARTALPPAAPRQAAPRQAAQCRGDTGHQLSGMVHSMLCATASAPYTTAIEGHTKLYKTLLLLVETLAEEDLGDSTAGYCVKTLKSILQIAVQSAEHLGTRPGCGLNAMLRYTNSQLTNCLLAPESTAFSATTAAAALEAARTDNGRGGGGGASSGGGGGRRRGGGNGGGSSGNRAGGGGRQDRERDRSPPPRSPDRGGDRYRRKYK